MNLHELQKHWNAFGKKDPMYSILTRPGNEKGNWDKNVFFQTGIKEINRVNRYFGNLGYSLEGGTALDFGCGIGRVTTALALFCDEVYGVDISPAMINRARMENTQGSKCSFFLNEKNDLQLFKSGFFDFVYSNLTLQHMAPEYAKNYIIDFLRVLKPGGLLLFQIPSKPKSKSVFRKFFDFMGVPEGFYHIVNLQIDQLKWWLFGKPIMQMNGIPSNEIVDLVESREGIILDIKMNRNAGDKWESFSYLVTKEKFD